jgi:hypothetical protein
MKQYIILSLALLIISMIAACGQKGPLHHPAEPSKSSQNLVWCFIQIDDDRSLLRPGDKAQCAGNGSPFSSIATQYPGLSRLPFGRDAIIVNLYEAPH